MPARKREKIFYIQTILGILIVAQALLFLPFQARLPVYSDEYEHRFLSARIFHDGGKQVYLSPQCQPGFLLPPPKTAYPNRLFDALLYGHINRLSDIRIIGLVEYICNVILAILLVAAVLEVPLRSAVVPVLAVINIGILPFMLISARPEQDFVTGLLLLLLLFVKRPQGPVGLRGDLLRLGALVFLSFWLNGATSRGVFFQPILWVAGFFILRRLWMRWSLIALSLISAAETYLFWSARLDCAQLPKMKRFLSSFTIAPFDFFHTPFQTMSAFLDSLSHGLDLIPPLLLQPAYQSNWMFLENSWPTNVSGTLANLCVYFVLSLGIFVMFSAITYAIWQRKKKPTNKAFVLSCAILAMTLATVGFQVLKNFYLSGLIYAVAALAVLLAIASLKKSSFFHKTNKYIYIALLFSSFCSQSVLLSRMPSVLPHWDIVTTSVDDVINQAERLLHWAHYVVDDKTQNALIDAYVLPVFWKTKTPLLIPYIVGWWGQQFGADFKEVLAQKKPPLILLPCVDFAHLGIAPQYNGGAYCLSILNHHLPGVIPGQN